MGATTFDQASDRQIAIRHFWSGEGNLSYLITNPETKEAFLIDPDLEILGTYLLFFDREQIQLVASIDTHNHAEHATAAPALTKLTGADYYMNHRARSSFVTQKLQDEDERVIAGITVRFFHSPGHTPDLQVVQVGKNLFTGDCLFIKSSGRTDFPGSDPGQQFESLKRLMHFPDDFIVHPGHDYNQQLSTTIGEIKKNNPRVQFTDKDEFIRFMAEFYVDNEKPDDWEYYVAFNAR